MCYQLDYTHCSLRWGHPCLPTFNRCNIIVYECLVIEWLNTLHNPNSKYPSCPLNPLVPLCIPSLSPHSPSSIPLDSLSPLLCISSTNIDSLHLKCSLSQQTLFPLPLPSFSYSLLLSFADYSISFHIQISYAAWLCYGCKNRTGWVLTGCYIVIINIISIKVIIMIIILSIVFRMYMIRHV